MYKDQIGYIVTYDEIKYIKTTRFNKFLLKLISTRKTKVDEGMDLSVHLQRNLLELDVYYKRFRNNIAQYNTFKWKN